MEQGSQAWLLERCGRITGSRFKAAMDRNKRTGEPNKARRTLVAVLQQEIATGCPEVTEPNEYMAHGNAMEPRARLAYEFLRDVRCEVPAFIRHPTLSYVGYSPDGLVGDDGLIEIKSPFLEPRHTRTVDSQKCPDDYIAQVQGGLWVTGRQWCDFVSYFPSISVEIVRVHRDEAFIKRLADECASVWAEVIEHAPEIAA
jgi:putative phage-type endonuclease